MQGRENLKKWKFVFSYFLTETKTFAMEVNMPARTVVCFLAFLMITRD